MRTKHTPRYLSHLPTQIQYVYLHTLPWKIRLGFALVVVVVFVVVACIKTDKEWIGDATPTSAEHINTWAATGTDTITNTTVVAISIAISARVAIVSDEAMAGAATAARIDPRHERAGSKQAKRRRRHR